MTSNISSVAPTIAHAPSTPPAAPDTVPPAPPTLPGSRNATSPGDDPSPALPDQLTQAQSGPQAEAVLASMGVQRPTRVGEILKGAALFGGIAGALGLGVSLLPGIGPIVAVIGGAAGAIFGAIKGNSNYAAATGQYELQLAYMRQQLAAGPTVYMPQGLLGRQQLTPANIDRYVDAATGRLDGRMDRLDGAANAAGAATSLRPPANTSTHVATSTTTPSATTPRPATPATSSSNAAATPPPGASASVTGGHAVATATSAPTPPAAPPSGATPPPAG